MEPVSTSVPAPDFVRPKPLPPSPIVPPTVSVLASTCTVRLPPSVMAPEPVLSVAVPRKRKSPFQVCRLLVVNVRAAETSNSPPLITNRPVPRAPSLPRESKPPLSVVTPV